MSAQGVIREKVRALARRQHGVATRAQLLALGMTRRQIGGRLATGEFSALHRGVYLVGPIAPPFAHEMAAVMACVPNAALSHRSAAHVYEILSYPTNSPR